MLTYAALCSNFLEGYDMVKRDRSKLRANLENVQRFPGFGLLDVAGVPEFIQ
jgi:hypothetical protein